MKIKTRQNQNQIGPIEGWLSRLTRPAALASLVVWVAALPVAISIGMGLHPSPADAQVQPQLAVDSKPKDDRADRLVQPSGAPDKNEDQPAVAMDPQHPRLSDERVIFHTNLGDLAVALFPDVAPKHVAQILKMVRAGVYTGMPIFRIESGFVGQVGNFDIRPVPLSEAERATVQKLPGEFSEIHHRRGLLSMARYDDPNSAESSFSFMFGAAPHLDRKYTVFGEVVSGFDVLEAIENVPVNSSSDTTPVVDVRIERAEVVSVAQLRQTKLKQADLSALPGMKSKTGFEIFAALMFSFTVLLPFFKAVFQPMPASRNR